MGSGWFRAHIVHRFFLKLTAAQQLAFDWIACSSQVNLLKSGAPLLVLAKSIYYTIVNRGIVSRGDPLLFMIEGNGYESRQSSLLYVFVLFLGLERAQNTIVVYFVLRN